jgi:hypothetical protein
MIQRIQSLYLFIVAVLASLALFGGWSFYSAEGSKTAALSYVSSVVDGVRITEVFSMLLLAAVMLLPLIIIFLFKNRLLQLRLCWMLMALVVLMAIMAFLRYRHLSAQLLEQTGVEGRIGFLFLFPLLMLVFIALAMRGIWKDEDLVRGMDRLRS